MDVSLQLRPLEMFMDFLNKERAAIARLAENQKKPSGRSQSHVTTAPKSHTNNHSNDHRKNRCFMPCHDNTNVKHSTAICREFRKLSVAERHDIVKNASACFRCLGNHRRENCTSDKSCRKCGRANHNVLLCRKPDNKPTNEASVQEPLWDKNDENEERQKSATNGTYSNNVKDQTECALYPILQGFVTNSGKWATIFCDGGSNCSYITHKAAYKLRAKRLNRFTLDVTTMGGVDTTYDTCLYEFSIRSECGKIIPVRAFGMEKITGPVTQLDENCIHRLFPSYDPVLLQRKSKEVDILLGCDYFGLHPKQEVCTAGDNLSIMKGDLGICLQGYHPDLSEGTEVYATLVKEVHGADLKTRCNLPQSHHHMVFNGHASSSHQDSACCSIGNGTVINPMKTETMLTKAEDKQMSSFIQGEELGTEIKPKCGGCQCTKCPLVGHTFSFKEQQELDMIRGNLRYEPEMHCWFTSYPWLMDPANLPENYHVALATLKNTESALSKDAVWAEKYASQMEDMLDRGVARELSQEELNTWSGPVLYISHLAVKNPHSTSTPVRIVFNSSQVTRGVSLNSSLAKGPDGYMNNMLGLLLRWREEPVAVIGDIRKMFNSVHLEPVEQHCHRFLWRDLDVARDPDVYVITRVNMGDRPAPAICTEAMYATADMFEQDDPKAAHVIRHSTYVDDILDSFQDEATAKEVIGNVEGMLATGGFHIKWWRLSGGETIERGKTCISEKSRPAEQQTSILDGGEAITRVLGVGWRPEEDCIVFKVNLNFSPKKRGKRTSPNLTVTQVPRELPEVVTRRGVLEQVMMIFDPLGLMSPFTLLAKIYLRETWALRKGWDEALPPDLHQKWTQFFCLMFEAEQLRFERNLHPSNAEGPPWLILMSGGSDVAYGFVAYIRCKLTDGSYWCRLIMSKSRIAPLSKRSTPQMELNGAVLSKRGRVVIEREMRYSFEKVLHIVDSETVLNMINKVSTRFKVYEGVRLGEIQAATNGDMSCWAWISGNSNTADLLTRGRNPQEIGPESEWWKGPAILYQPFETWGLKFGLQKEEPVPGEKKLPTSSNTVTTTTHTQERQGAALVNYENYSSIIRVYWVVARLLSMARLKSFKGGQIENVTPELLLAAEELVVKDAQRHIGGELRKVSAKKTGGQYASLKPMPGAGGVWIVGARLTQYNPMTPENEPQRLLPHGHAITKLIMKQCHESSGHRGRDGTLAKFRQKFWTPRASKLAWTIKSNCQLCRLRDPKLIQQAMSPLPEARTKPSPPFNRVMVDFFGPYLVRGEVQKRISSKAYGVIFTDLTMRAVHIEAVFGYDTGSFLMALSRFASLRGWPEIIYSDPGSQLIGADREMRDAWHKLDKLPILKKSTENGLRWVFGPADSPWHQGAVESMVKCTKRAIHYAVHSQRLSPAEFLTLCADISNLINERPLGIMPGIEASISILTPNSLLLGRASAKNPGGWQPENSNIARRFNLVQQITQHFWERWTELCAPSLLVQRKWHKSSRNLQKGDVVLVADKNTLRGNYHLGLIKEVFPGKDGKVRRVSLTYKNFKVGEQACEYHGSADTVVTRSVQRLALLVPIEPLA